MRNEGRMFKKYQDFIKKKKLSMSLNINILEIRSEISIVHFYFVSRIHEPLLHFRDHCLIR